MSEQTKDILCWIAVGVVIVSFWGWTSWMAKGQEVSLGATVRWNCENMKTNPHPIPLDFVNDSDGNWDVALADGSILTGKRYDGYMKWTWEDAWWHTNGTDVVYCESDAKALSILMAQ